MALSSLDGQLQAASRALGDLDSKLAAKQAVLAHLHAHGKPLPELIAEKERQFRGVQKYANFLS